MKMKIKNFLKSYHSILILYTIFVLGLIIFCHNIMKSYKLYEFEGSSEMFILDSGLIYRGRDINRFNGAFITYLGDKEQILSYDIGYYLEDGTVISRLINNGGENVVFRLSDVLDMPFTLTENAKESLIFNKKFTNEKLFLKLNIEYVDGTVLEEKIELHLNLISG